MDFWGVLIFRQRNKEREGNEMSFSNITKAHMTTTDTTTSADIERELMRISISRNALPINAHAEGSLVKFRLLALDEVDTFEMLQQYVPEWVTLVGGDFQHLEVLDHPEELAQRVQTIADHGWREHLSPTRPHGFRKVLEVSPDWFNDHQEDQELIDWLTRQDVGLRLTGKRRDQPLVRFIGEDGADYVDPVKLSAYLSF